MIVAAIAVVATGWIVLVLGLCRAMAPKTDEERRHDDDAQMAALRKFAGRDNPEPTGDTRARLSETQPVARPASLTRGRVGSPVGSHVATPATGYIDPDPAPVNGIVRPPADLLDRAQGEGA